MPLHPQIAKILPTLPAPQFPLDPVAMRAGEEAEVSPVGERLPVHAVEERAVPTANAEIPVRIYTPGVPGRGALVYLHGGAFFLGNLDTHDHVARSLANATGLCVVSVGYRLAPEHAFPAGLEDCYAIVRWVAEHGRDEIGWDGSTLAVAGDSSGGNFVAALVAMAHDDGLHAITHQVLLYPSLDLDFDADRYPSLRENATGYGLETAGLRPFNQFYLDSGADPDDPRVSPVKRADLSGLPPALILTGEFDPLRDEGERYGELLRAAGVPVTVARYKGAGHGFVQHFSWLPEYGRAFEQIADFIAGEGR